MSDFPCGGAQQEQRLMLYVGGELLLWERLRIEAHLRSCPICREQQRLMLRTMQNVAAEVRGYGLPAWEAQGITVSGSAISGRLLAKPISSGRFATLAALSAAVAVLTSYTAATYGDRLMTSHSAPLSRVSTPASPPCETTPEKPVRPCHDCASPAPKSSIK